MISVIIPTYDRISDLNLALDSLKTNSFFNNEIIVLSPLENNEIKAVCQRYNAKLINDKSRVNGKRVKGLWSIINFGISLSGNKYVCWLNDDCLVLKDWDKFALNYFQDSLVSMVILKSKGLDNIQEFTTIKAFSTIDCANYAILDKTIGLRFDEKFNWFHGDSDISLQCVVGYDRKVIATIENCVIHNHRIDIVRSENEEDNRSLYDKKYFNTKWKRLTVVNDRIVNLSLYEYYNLKFNCRLMLIKHYLKNVFNWK